MLVILILQFIKMKQENIDTSIDTKKMNLNIGINQELIHLVFGIFIMASTNNNCKLLGY